MECDWQPRAYREGDEEKILKLCQSVYPNEKHEREKWMRWWHWMYKDNPAGAGVIWIAEHEGKIVGQYAIIPMMMSIAGETFTGALSLNTMTHPDYRHQGIFETLAKRTFSQAKKTGIRVVYGFPNNFSHPGFIRKLAWFDIAPTQTIIRPLNWENTLRTHIDNEPLLRICTVAGNLATKTLYRTRKIPGIEGLTISQIHSFDDRINHFIDEVSNQHKIMIVRNRVFLNWRYVSTPNTDYSIYVAEKAGKIHGYIILECNCLGQTKRGIIFDILSLSEEITQHLISKVIEHCQQHKVDLIYCAMIANKPYHNAFRKAGFISIPFIKSGYFCAYSNFPSIPKALLEDPKGWFIQVGDGDAT